MAKRTFVSVTVHESSKSTGSAMLAIANDGTAWLRLWDGKCWSEWRQVASLPDSEDPQS